VPARPAENLLSHPNLRQKNLIKAKSL